ncbi:hypothetical protein KTO58_05570 [Chitinophaga pendula]|uniref:hypothetical protein n=1 Tax=Chitinophaga TaxID=79328 RepID=UPI0012FE6F6B|nr:MULTISPECIES: hypothetical protein [Chitinophaga]UCJ08656.1 hypothetical protein KTO58_05570 [Chitinophaga pendula]
MQTNNNDIPDNIIYWKGSREEFIEFVMIVADYSICTTSNVTITSATRFLELCDELGSELARLFKVDISPHATFKLMREHTKIDYCFTKSVIQMMKRPKEDEHFLQMLEDRGIMPSIEYISEGLLKWGHAEKIATLLWLYIQRGYSYTILTKAFIAIKKNTVECL